jgi:hypothetical protein
MNRTGLDESRFERMGMAVFPLVDALGQVEVG